MTRQNLNDAAHWRDRAAETRVLSEVMTNPETKSTMLKLANDYDVLADRALQPISLRVVARGHEIYRALGYPVLLNLAPA